MAVPRPRRERKLPVQQLSILEPVASTSLFPYLPEMVESFGVPESDVGKWAGLLAAAFSISQAVFGIPWGRFSDLYGRKPSILLGLTSTMCTSLLLGFSVNLPMAMVARALAGAGNGNVGILRTTVAEMVPFKELQPRAFSIMPLVWNIGSVFGPSLGGALANPSNIQPGEKRPHPSVLEAFPYLLPNLISAIFFTMGITVGFLFLEETLESRRYRRDYGLLLGSKIVRFTKRSALKFASLLRPASAKQHANGTEPLLKPTHADVESDAPPKAKTANLPAPSFKEVLNPQSTLNLVTYTILALHSIAYDQLLPVFMHSNPIGAPHTTPFSPPLKFAGGIGLNHFSIGLMSTGYGIAGMVVQFLFFPPLCRRYGVLFWFRLVSCVFPLVYLATPFVALLPTPRAQVIGVFAVMLAKSVCVIFAFPCSMILLTNSARSLRVLGTLNGCATTVAAVGRAAGPAIGGAMFTIGMKRGYLIAPWWFLAAVAIVGAVAVFWVVDGEGFEAEDVEDDDGEEVGEGEQYQDDRTGVLQSAALDGEAQAAGRPGPMMAPTQELETTDAREHGYGTLTPLSRMSTNYSAIETDEDGDEGLLGPSHYRTMTSSQQEESALSQQTSQKLTRRTSNPIGMGAQGIGRKYSTNLGQSLSSQGSFQQH